MASISLKAEQIETDRYLNLEALSQYSGITIRTLRDYLHDISNPIPSFQIKRKILVKKTDFDSWVEGYRVDKKRINQIVDEIVKKHYEKI
jgi:hypothetical protein